MTAQPAQPLTDGSGPGGRPRKRPPAPSAFAVWLGAARRCPTCDAVVSGAEQLAEHNEECSNEALESLTTSAIADLLGVAKSSVYNLRNAYFAPGLDLALKVAELSHGAVPVDSWTRPQRTKPTRPKAKRKRRSKAKGKR